MLLQTEGGFTETAIEMRIMENQFTLPLWESGAPLLDEADKGPLLTAYLVPQDRLRGAVVVCPGGGYAARADHEGEPIALWLNSLGMNAFVVDYRVSPYRHPVPLMDAQRAIRLVRHSASGWGIDPAKVGILGFSAGGHLAATAGTHFDPGDAGASDPIERRSSRPDALVLCYPVITFGEYQHGGSMSNLLGDKPDPQLRASLSNETQVSAETPPAFLWHTADDGAVPVENSLLFATALSAKKIPFELHVYPTGVHGLGLGQDHPVVSQWTAACGIWLKGLGF